MYKRYMSGTRQMNLREYARYRGVTLQAVQKAIKNGRLSESVKQSGNVYSIDADLADKEWSENTDQNFLRGENNQSPQPDLGPGSKKFPPFSESRAIREAYEARIKRLEYEQKAGKLVSVDEVKEEYFNIARLIRNSILAIPQKISMELASENDPHRIEQILDKEHRLALEELSRSRF